jgi:HlyD family secretion protein
LDSSLKTILSKSWKWILLIILIALVIYKVKFSPAEVSTSLVKSGEVVEEVMGTGTLEAHYQTTVSSKIQGLIVELLADQNDWVESGQLLARLDDSDLAREVSTQEAIVNADEATVERVKADQARSKAIFDQAQRDYDRYAGLLVSKSISQEVMDKTVQGLAVAEADVARSIAAIREADRQVLAARERLRFQQARLGDTRIYSPFSGLIVRRDRDVGDIVVPGATIFRLVSTREMWVSAWIDETSMAGLKLGQKARVIFRSETKQAFNGKVVRIGREVDRETREFKVDVGLESLPQNWAVGQRAEVYIETARKNDVINIPLQALVWRKTTPGVYLANEGRAHWREVSLGSRGIDRVEILKGLSLNDSIITGPDPYQLTDGLRVYGK